MLKTGTVPIAGHMGMCISATTGIFGIETMLYIELLLNALYLTQIISPQ